MVQNLSYDQCAQKIRFSESREADFSISYIEPWYPILLCKKCCQITLG